LSLNIMTAYMTEKCIWYKNNIYASLRVSPNSQRQGSKIWRPDQLV